MTIDELTKLREECLLTAGQDGPDRDTQELLIQCAEATTEHINLLLHHLPRPVKFYE